MQRFQVLGRVLGGAAVITLASCASVPNESAESVLQRANAAMGGQQLQSVSFSGSGSGATFGQAFLPGQAWPKIKYSSVVRVADYANGAWREDASRARAEPTGGGAVPLMGMGEQRTSGWMRAGYAWNMVGPAPVAAPIALDGRVHDLWTTPHGVIKAALTQPSSVKTRSEGGRTLQAVSFTMPGRFSAMALINGEGLVEQVESLQPHPVLGDTPSVIRYSEYRDVGGAKFPMRIQQSMGGFEVLDLQVSEVKLNVSSGIEVPALVSAASERVTADEAAPGVWFIGGGSHNSVAIEMKDHMLLVESPLWDGRALPVLAEVKKLRPGKPLRSVINSHHHFDHAGGLRTAVAEGASLITSAQAQPYFERVLANPNRINPDALQKSGRQASISGVDGKRVLSDGERQVEIHFIDSSLHAQGFMMVYLPREKLLIEADAYTPGAPNAPAPAVPSELNVNLLRNIERLNLQVERILPLHGRMVALAELQTAAGVKR